MPIVSGIQRIFWLFLFGSYFGLLSQHLWLTQEPLWLSQQMAEGFDGKHKSDKPDIKRNREDWEEAENRLDKPDRKRKPWQFCA